MSVHNLQGALELQSLGFKRVVLSRELSIEEIEYITQNVDIEIECFIHGALCISYSGQCLFSSMIGGRSGNRGKCAQGCRLPYELIENEEKVIDKGYLLSPRDLCALDYIPRLLNCGVKCLKIEGRMKNSEYVAIVTRIYRKYIDLAKSGKPYIIDEKDKTDLLQAFNRGNFSVGHLDPHPNQDLIFKEKPNNMGLLVGHISKYNSSKGLITLSTNQPLQIGDTVSLEKETGTYTISELMSNNNNLKQAHSGDLVTIGRMKGKIKVGDKVYKMTSKTLQCEALASFENDVQNKKIPLNCEINIQKNSPISMRVRSASNLELYKKLNIYCQIDTMPVDAQKHPLEKEKVISQISKTTNSLYYFKNIKIDLEENVFLPNIKSLNELRRTALELVEEYATSKVTRTSKSTLSELNLSSVSSNTQNISLLLNTLSSEINYAELEGISNIYLPLKYFTLKNYSQIISLLSQKFNVYIYMPTIIKANYRNLLVTNIENTISKYNIRGFVISNISNIKLLEQYSSNDFDFVANYSLNIFNKYSINELINLGIKRFTISPELNKETINELATMTNQELIVYGRTPLMNMNYCPIGNSNHCYPTCQAKCSTENKYYLKDRMNFKFPLIPDKIQTVSTLYNSKTTSISPNDFSNIRSLRIDILEESTLSEIQNIINTVKSGNRFEGQNYTNGNLNKLV